MESQDVQQILKISGFVHNKLLFKYLGVLVCFERISSVECEVLIEKIVARVKIWSSRHLSYGGRATLVNSVLDYLWHGTTVYESPGQVAWKEVCKPNKIGGLRFCCRLEEWNIAAIEKHICSLV
ncbi:uncharacterized protein LOC115699859 [Cannabis sativa]|uniref:uncharacterized protein LOC115699859 n=1 Tax=Cannabis sativa TaxID=3483 RepID=UPI0029CA4176|nr:uncharacterized protein LOC115699859 [Cannabis sativa]